MASRLLKGVRRAKYKGIFDAFIFGGEEGIRTPVTVSGKPDFESGAFSHSATSPAITCAGTRTTNDFEGMYRRDKSQLMDDRIKSRGILLTA